MRLPRIMVAAPASGSGKTLVTCGLLRAFAARGMAPIAFKCGPDYIDPAFHRAVVGVPSSNLDLFFTGEARARSLMARAASDAGSDIAVVEGVMGFYDGLSCESDEASSYHVSRATSTPAVLVVDARGAALSVAATVAGFARFRPDARVVGAILNRCAPAVASRIAPAVEREAHVPVLGCLPADERFALESRRLGLVMPAEQARLAQTVDAIAAQLEETVDIDRLIGLASAAPDLAEGPFRLDPVIAPGAPAPAIAVAEDEAFCFCYRENLRALEDLGAKVVPFSPLRDRGLPAGACGLYLVGGYPELHAGRLSGNAAMRASVREAVASGMPVLAECGGFMYLQRELAGADGRTWPMVGALPGSCRDTGRLSHFGYVTLTAREGCALLPEGARARAHEFHYWHSTDEGASWRAAKPASARGWDCGVARGNIMAGFPHVYFPGEPDIARRLVRAMSGWGERS